MNKYRDLIYWLFILTLGTILFMSLGCSTPPKEKAIIVSHSKQYANTVFRHGFTENGFIVMAVCPTCGK